MAIVLMSISHLPWPGAAVQPKNGERDAQVVAVSQVTPSPIAISSFLRVLTY